MADRSSRPTRSPHNTPEQLKQQTPVGSVVPTAFGFRESSSTAPAQHKRGEKRTAQKKQWAEAQWER